MGYLMTVQENASKFLREYASTMEDNKGIPFDKNTVAVKLLRTLPEVHPPMISESAHNDAIDGHTEMLVLWERTGVSHHTLLRLL